ncbi:GNAT family N-acetyltransferase [Chitinophaga qingshengii]|uniref:GNAT family N-acetyltransferase n=1 Tax=Chitinophaga qingshengii TaxID=1569794 RepID=A0ABR7TFI9_9BACT|nr:GNAT family N-acetyltransferase [Chitinophaga qingshengii]MBC9929106.1 GNAT family N-acetyltransferase [Chitinophaga qingshengii]
MIIRPYTAADKPACLAAFRSNMPKFFAPGELTDFDTWLEEQGKRDLSDRNECYYVLALNNEIIGCGGYYIRGNGTAIMTWGLLHQQYHKQGWGKKLLLHRVAVIREICPSCTIQLDTSQHSAPFFEKLGFEVTKITPDFFGPGLDRYDMELRN